MALSNGSLRWLIRKEFFATTFMPGQWRDRLLFSVID
jgi:hypothetical protein